MKKTTFTKTTIKIISNIKSKKQKKAKLIEITKTLSNKLNSNLYTLVERSIFNKLNLDSSYNFSHNTLHYTISQFNPVLEKNVVFMSFSFKKNNSDLYNNILVNIPQPEKEESLNTYITVGKICNLLLKNESKLLKKVNFFFQNYLESYKKYVELPFIQIANEIETLSDQGKKLDLIYATHLFESGIINCIANPATTEYPSIIYNGVELKNLKQFNISRIDSNSYKIVIKSNNLDNSKKNVEYNLEIQNKNNFIKECLTPIIYNIE